MDINQRATEIVNLFKTLKEKNLGISEFSEFVDFREICNKYIRDGEPVKGEIKVLGTKRIICFDFTNKIECVLKYDKSV